MHIMNAIVLKVAAQSTTAMFPSPCIVCPNKCEGDPSKCKGFLIQRSVYFASQARLTGQQRVAEFISMLLGKALSWTTIVWCKEALATSSTVSSVFKHCPEGDVIRELLLTISQGNHDTAKYAFEFHMLMVGSSWNEPTLKAIFCVFHFLQNRPTWRPRLPLP